jgi:hypothetical protein
LWTYLTQKVEKSLEGRNRATLMLYQMLVLPDRRDIQPRWIS